MSPLDAHRRLERLLVDALLRGDGQSLRAVAADLPEELRSAVAHVDDTGFAVAQLLVARLRFERLMQGSREAAAWFARDAAGFAAAFRDYHAAVPPRAAHPQDEAVDFGRWMQR